MMDIGAVNNKIQQAAKKPDSMTGPSHSEHQGGFLGAAKRMFSILSAVPAEPAEKYGAAHFKKIKEKNKPEKKRTEEDAIKDIERLIRRIQKSKSCGNQSSR